MNDEEKNTVSEGEEREVQLCPFGEWPQTREDGERVVQVCDAEAFRKILENFDGAHEVLVDLDHESEKPQGSTQAAAWITAMRIDPQRGLMATLRYTDTGARAVSAGRMTRLSPCWEVDESGRPVRLLSVGLTNKPNIPVAKLLNRATWAANSTVGQNPQREEGNDMESIIEALGLEAGASEEQVLAAIAALREKVAEYEQRALNEEAEEEAEKHAEQIANRAAWIKAYKADPAGVRAVMNSLEQREAPRQRLVNARSAKSPQLPGRAGATLGERLSRMPVSRRRAYLAEHADEL